jgi:16S rRNA (cytosine1402-N4)-methyltransferase
MRRDYSHIPVLADAVIQHLQPAPGQTFVDCTLGLGGHSALLLRKISPGGTLVGFDFDPKHLARGRQVLEQTAAPQTRFILHQSNFASLTTALAADGITQVDGILADLGVASPQIDDPTRGFSYRREGPLDMRMDPTRGEPASKLIHRLSEEELRNAFLELGDETDAPRIAELIVERRRERPITTTQDLTAIICEARDFTLQRAAGAKLHPAARTFQAIRMMVNREIGNLERLLVVAPDLLKPGSRIGIISFHSGEDRRVKQAFKEGLRGGLYRDAADDPVIATPAEAQENPRARSAKLRWAERA